MAEELKQYQLLFIEPRGRKVSIEQGTSPKDCIKRYFNGQNVNIIKVHSVDREANVIIRLFGTLKAPTGYYIVTGFEPEILLNRVQYDLIGMKCVNILEKISNPKYSCLNNKGQLKPVSRLVDTYLDWVIDCNKGKLLMQHENDVDNITIYKYLEQQLRKKIGNR